MTWARCQRSKDCAVSTPPTTIPKNIQKIGDNQVFISVPPRIMAPAKLLRKPQDKPGFQGTANHPRTHRN
jgi:hypothetical protein